MTGRTAGVHMQIPFRLSTSNERQIRQARTSHKKLWEALDGVKSRPGTLPHLSAVSRASDARLRISCRVLDVFNETFHAKRVAHVVAQGVQRENLSIILQHHNPAAEQILHATTLRQHDARSLRAF